jgi:hypothetical protein
MNSNRLITLVLIRLFVGLMMFVSIQSYAGDRKSDSLKIESFLAIDSDNYTTIDARQKFYKKADKLFTNYGFEVKWLKVAAKTVKILEIAHSKIGGIFAHTNQEIRVFINNGNKAILDDFLLKVRALWQSGKVIREEEAMRWDAQMLSDEQNLIDGFYENLSKESLKILEKNLKGLASRLLFNNPRFYGNVQDQESRWDFGMRKMGYQVVPEMMPKPNQNWENVPLKITEKRRKKIEIEQILR